MNFLRSKRGLAAAGVLLLLALFLVRPGANRLRNRIVASISLAVGRPVEVSSVSLRLLPQPGFDLEDFIVHDDPRFSLEPVVRASEVTAVLRVSSLLRGKLEVARLSLTEPSLNLVRDGQGHWNLETLVERAAQIPAAPTAKASGETRPSFPYMEADGGRINFKFGQEKKPYVLTDADFALWQDSENTWGMRLRAQPMRTDFNLSDTGVLRVNGTWQRSASLRDTPLQFNLLWERAQLGQVTKLAYGSDQGWRGAIQVSANMIGTPGNLKITGAATVQDFRRYDVLGGIPMRLAAQCSGRYTSVDHRLFDLACSAPVGNGKLALEGTLTGLVRPRAYGLVLTAHSLPVQSLVALGRRAGRGVPPDVTASGVVNARLKLTRSEDSEGGGPSLEGGGEATDFRLKPSAGRAELAFASIPFSTRRTPGSDPALSSVGIDFGPLNLNLGRSAPVSVRGHLARFGYLLQVRGEGQVRRILQAAQTIGLLAPPINAEGTARMDLQVAGGWSATAPAHTSGKAQIRAVRAEVAGLNEPLEIASADLLLGTEEVKVTALNASLAGNAWHGSLVLPRHCGSAEEKCAVRFNLGADSIDTASLGRLVAPSPAQPWYRFLPSAAKPRVPFLAGLRARGKLVVSRLSIHGLSASRVTADVQLDSGNLRLSDLHADVLGGLHRGEWTADFTVQPPAYTGSGAFEHVALETLADAMHDDWITGTASATFDVKAFGSSLPQLLTSASGHLQVQARDGSFPRVILVPSGGPLIVERFAGDFLLGESKLELSEGKLEAPGGIYQVSGTASLAKTWNLQLTRDTTHTFNITGTLATPHVEQSTLADTRAALKQ